MNKPAESSSQNSRLSNKQQYFEREIPDTNPNGGCVGADWRDWWFIDPPIGGLQECTMPAFPRTCPTSAIFNKSRSTYPSSGTRLYCEGHWQKHLEQEETWLIENDPRIKRNNKLDKDASYYMDGDLQYLHPDELPGPLTIGESLISVAVLILSAISIVTVVIFSVVMWYLNK